MLNQRSLSTADLVINTQKRLRTLWYCTTVDKHHRRGDECSIRNEFAGLVFLLHHSEEEKEQRSQ